MSKRLSQLSNIAGPQAIRVGLKIILIVLSVVFVGKTLRHLESQLDNHNLEYFLDILKRGLLVYWASYCIALIASPGTDIFHCFGSVSPGRYVRFITTSEDDLSLVKIEKSLKESDENYELESISSPQCDLGFLRYGSDIYGEVGLRRKGYRLFDVEIDMLKKEVEEIGKSDSDGQENVLKILDQAKGMVIVIARPVEVEEYGRVERLWKLLFEDYSGLLHEDGRGYYNENNICILSESNKVTENDGFAIN
jgi:hypothetical protein